MVQGKAVGECTGAYFRCPGREVGISRVSGDSARANLSAPGGEAAG